MSYIYVPADFSTHVYYFPTKWKVCSLCAIFSIITFNAILFISVWVFGKMQDNLAEATATTAFKITKPHIFKSKIIYSQPCGKFLPIFLKNWTINWDVLHLGSFEANKQCRRNMIELLRNLCLWFDVPDGNFIRHHLYLNTK